MTGSILALASPAAIAGMAAEYGIGYPRVLPHPVMAMGAAVSAMERLLRNPADSPAVQIAKGSLLAATLVACTFLCFAAVGMLFTSPLPSMLYRTACVFALMATGSLVTECAAVPSLLAAGDIDGARRQLAMLVTRDTTAMDGDALCRTTVETLSENLNDGVVAPLFWLFVGGVPAAMAYKMASTLDSMVGYKNDRYRWFGRASARLDDVLAWLPARITALVATVAAFLCGLDGMAAFRVWRRDGNRHASPNSGHPEAAFAGALGIRFGGTVRYFGEDCEKPVIGDDPRSVVASDVTGALRLARCTAVLCITLGTFVELAVRL